MDEDGNTIVNSRGKPVMEKTELFGKGLRYRARYIDPDGAERSKSFPDREKKRADDFLIEVESDKREGKYIDPRASRKTFRQIAESWYRGQSSDPATRETLRSRLDSRVYPVFGDLSVGSIKPSTVRDWLGCLDERKYADNYKAVLFDIVVGVMDAAVDERLIRENPCRAKTVRRPVRRSPQIAVWGDERVAGARRGVSAVDERYSVVVPLGVGLGLRQGEILGLSSEDIDREAMTVHVRRQVKYVRGTLMFALPKREKTRFVPLSRALLAVIDAHVAAFPSVPVTLPWASADGKATTVSPLVVTPTGAAISGDLFNKIVWQPAFGKAGLVYMKRADGMHALRHLYASKLLARGVSVKELAEYLGHADAGFTLRVYTHLLPSSHERARQAVDETASIWELPSGDGLEAA
ncbi:tyrosine-type recombinase/integrase [Nocardia takedensis]|uniref:tyrosine-type recombinase/integrase n=1 Tax=Nocardia takedensis TaxID=259390 RepID=UPI001FDEEC76|nr:site-specific integrase [Nocardia takedensis]